MRLLAGVAVLLEPEGVVPCLVVEHQDLGAAANRLQSRNLLAWAEIDPLFMPTQRQCGPPAWPRRAAVQVPELQAAVVVPEDPLPVERVVPVLPRWDRLAGAVAEPAPDSAQ